VALAIILATKLLEGAWVTILTIAGLILLFKLVHRQYRKLAAQIATYRPCKLEHAAPPVVLLPFRAWDKPTEKSLRFGMWLSSDIVAVHLINVGGNSDEGEAREAKEQWKDNVETPLQQAGLPLPKLIVVESKYREFAGPLLAQINRLEAEFPSRPIAVIIPEAVSRHWWEKLLHVRYAAQLRAALCNRGDKRVVVISLPWYIKD
jgi:hypothetical protein